MAFDLSEYEPVASRIAKFYAAHPDGRIITDLVHYLPDHAVFKAEIWVGNVLVATGWEEEIRGSSSVNRTSHVANAETSAVGRGLANYNLAGTDPEKRASREEMGKVERMGASPARSQDGPRRPIVNKYGKACVKCGGMVEAGAGLAATNDAGKWETFHQEGQCTAEEPF